MGWLRELWNLAGARSLGREIAALVRDERTRVIHGLEHATVAVLQESGVVVRRGQSGEPGFEIVIEPDKGRHVTPAFMRQSVIVAIKRVLAGDTAITRSPACGTSQLVALVLVSMLILAAAVLFVLGNTSLTPAIVLAVLAELVVCGLARYFGLLAQKYFTVSTRFRAAKVGSIDFARMADGAQLFSVPLKITRAAHEPRQPRA